MITYIIKFIICSGLLLAVYRGFLSNERLYKFNRFYLLFSLVFSLAVPFITINAPAINLPYFNAVTEQPVTKPINTPTLYTDTAPLTNVTEPTVSSNELSEQSISSTVVNKPMPQPIAEAPARNYWPQILLVIYGLVVSVLLFRFAKNSRHISYLVGKNAVVNHNDTKLVLIEEDITPHSFLKYVFVNKEAYQNGEVEPEIICHEQAHIKQLHSLDVIFIELLQIVCWFNPFIIYYRRAIQLNHEFLADEAVIENYNNTKAYQYLLLEKASQCGSLYLTSQFNYLITKKRLIMMTKQTSAKIGLYKKVAILPLLAIAIFLFSQKSIAENLSTDITGNTTKISNGANVHVVTPAEWKFITGTKFNLGGDVATFIEKFNKKNNSKYRLLTEKEFELLAKTKMGHVYILKNTNQLVLIEGSISNSEEAGATKIKDMLYFDAQKPHNTLPDSLVWRGPRKGRNGKPMEMVRILITYPSTTKGATAAQLKEYAAIEAKYLNANGNVEMMLGKDLKISAADRAMMEDLFAKMSKEQQYEQKIGFTFNKPYPLHVPTQAQVDLWKSDKMYRLTIDHKLATAAELAKYKATDFSYFYKAHIEWQKKRKPYQKYEIELMTNSYFQAKNDDRIKNSMVIYNIQPGIRKYTLYTKNGKTVMEVSSPDVKRK